MFCAKKTTFILFVMYFSPLMSEVYLLVNYFFQSYVTFIFQWIAFIFGRTEEEDQQASLLQETTLTSFIMYFSPLMSEVYPLF